LARTRARIQQQPANGQRLPAKRIDFDRNLIVSAAYTPRLDFQHGLDVFDGLLEYRKRIGIALLGDLLHRAVEDALRVRALAVPHHRIDELLHQLAAEHRVGRNFTPWYESFSWHPLSPLP